jgi:hypothetical protein
VVEQVIEVMEPINQVEQQCLLREIMVLPHQMAVVEVEEVQVVLGHLVVVTL